MPRKRDLGGFTIAVLHPAVAVEGGGHERVGFSGLSVIDRGWSHAGSDFYSHQWEQRQLDVVVVLFIVLLMRRARRSQVMSPAPVQAPGKVFLKPVGKRSGIGIIRPPNQP
jgi:hypothetical protein